MSNGTDDYRTRIENKRKNPCQTLKKDELTKESVNRTLFFRTYFIAFLGWKGLIALSATK
jgi:hypothetical protein